jgi:hypothetical protein
LSEKVQNVDEFRDGLFSAAERITNETLFSTWRETEYRLDVCRAAIGAHTDLY